MKKNQANQTSPSVEGTKWVLLALPKTCVIKRTKDYLLFDVDGQASGIVSAKFIRAKESDTHLFVSLPENYEVNCRVNEPDEKGKYRTIKTYVIKAIDLKAVIKQHEKLSSVPSDELPF